MPKFLAPIDLVKNELQNATIQNLSSAPSGGLKGGLFYDTSVDRLKVNIGTAGSPNWVSLTTAAETGFAFSTITGGDGGSAIADATSDTLTLSSANSTYLTITGSDVSDTMTFTVNAATSRSSNATKIVATQAADGKIDTTFMTGKLAASDLTNGTTGSGSIVLASSPTIVTPTIASFTNAQHNHQNAAGGGQLDHGLAITGSSLLDDDHTQYALLAGRSGGQTLIGGTAAADNLTLTGTSNGSPTSGNAIILTNNFKTQAFLVAAPTVVDNTINICTATFSSSMAHLEITLVTTSGANVISKAYSFAATQTGGDAVFVGVAPLFDSGPASASDYSLEYAYGSTATLRIRRTQGTGAVNIRAVVKVYGTPTDTITASSTTSTSAVSTYLGATGLTITNGGTVMHGTTLNMGNTVAGTTGGGTLNMAGGNITNGGTITATTFNGSFSGSGLFADGSAASPSISFTNANNVGFYKAASGAVALVAGSSSERMRVDGTGLSFFGSTTVAQQSGDIATALLNYGLMSTATSLNFAAGGQVTADTVQSAASQGLNVQGQTTLTLQTVTGGSSNGISILSANNGAGSTGSIGIATGSSVGGTSGSVTITTGGVGNSQTSGDITFNTGNIGSGGTKGSVYVKVANATLIQANGTGLGFFGATPVAQQGATVSLETVLSNLGLRVAGSSAPISTGTQTIADGSNIVVGTTTGTQIGTSTTQKLGFFGATPVVQQGATVSLETVLSTLGFRAAGSSAPLAIAQLTIADGSNIVLGTTTGTKIGTATTQKIGFFNATPVAQQSGDIRTALLNLGFMSTATSLNFASGGQVTADTYTSVGAVSYTSAAGGNAITVQPGTNSTVSGTGAALNLFGGVESGTTSTGGSVILKPGTGTSTNGSVTIQNSAGTAQIQVNSTGIGFFNVTPVAQQGATVSLETALSNLGLRAAGTSAPLAIAQLTIADGSNIVLGTTTGTKIGTATNQKIGFFNAAPVVQQSGEIAAALVALGLMSTATALTISGALSAGTGSFSGAVNMNSHQINNVTDPTNPQDAATKNYVDSVATGLDFKQSARVASTANVTVTYAASGGTSARGQITAAPNTIDGVSLAAGNRILLKDQTAGSQNGIWVVTTLGTGANGVWDRATDFDQDAEVTSGAFVFIEEGTVNGNSGWVLTTDNPITIGGAVGSTPLTWAQFSGAGTYTAGSGLTLTGTQFSVNTNSTLGTTITSNNVVLTGQALAFHQVGTGIPAVTAAGSVSARTITGTSNRLSVTNGNGVSGNPTLDIDSNYIGQTSITTLGTITTGTWTGTAIAVLNGGTGATSAAGAKTNLGFMTRFAATITGDGSTTSFPITHNMGTTDIEILIQDTTNGETVYPNVRVTSTTAASIIFGIAPANLTTYRVIVIG